MTTFVRLLATAIIGVATLAPAADAFTHHRCEGHVDYACYDPSGAFCTVWLRTCQIGA